MPESVIIQVEAVVSVTELEEGLFSTRVIKVHGVAESIIDSPANAVTLGHAMDNKAPPAVFKG